MFLRLWELHNQKSNQLLQHRHPTESRRAHWNKTICSSPSCHRSMRNPTRHFWKRRQTKLSRIRSVSSKEICINRYEVIYTATSTSILRKTWLKWQKTRLFTMTSRSSCVSVYFKWSKTTANCNFKLSTMQMISCESCNKKILSNQAMTRQT